jgi:hypothetical protein
LASGRTITDRDACRALDIPAIVVAAYVDVQRSNCQKPADEIGAMKSIKRFAGIARPF